MIGTDFRGPDYFTGRLKQTDPEVHEAIAGELARQQNQIELIVSDNIVRG